MAATGYTSGDSRKLDKTGGAMTGPLTLHGSPSQPLHAAPKQYVDAAASALAAHEADTTGVHGIADTSALETQAGAAAKVTAHVEGSDPHGDRADAASRYLSLTGGTVSGALTIGTPADPASLNVVSGYVPDSGQDDIDGIDYTGRINLYSYQRASFHSYGEVLRIYSRKWDSKQMIAWYGPTSYTPYNSVTDIGGDPVGSDRPWFWMGAHYEANDHGSVHGHWSCEVPDSTGALQTRLEFTIWDPVTGAYGMDKCLIKTNNADFVVRCSNGQVLRLSASAGVEKALEISNDSNGATAHRRWKLRATSTAESGGNAGSDLQIVRYDDTGTLVDAPLVITRSTGLVSLGGTSGTAGGLAVTRNTGTSLTLTNTGAGATAVAATLADTASRGQQFTVAGDTVPRHAVFADGKTEWGSGAATRDVNLYRSTADVLRTDDSFHVGANLRVNTTSLGGGSGVVAIANATVVPAGAPVGGGVLFAEGGALKWRNPSGATTQLAPG